MFIHENLKKQVFLEKHSKEKILSCIHPLKKTTKPTDLKGSHMHI